LKIIGSVVLLIAVIGYIVGYRVSCCGNGWLSIEEPTRFIKLSEKERSKLPECINLHPSVEELSFNSNSEFESYLKSNEVCAQAQIKYLKTKK